MFIHIFLFGKSIIYNLINEHGFDTILALIDQECYKVNHFCHEERENLDLDIVFIVNNSDNKSYVSNAKTDKENQKNATNTKFTLSLLLPLALTSEIKRTLYIQESQVKI